VHVRAEEHGAAAGAGEARDDARLPDTRPDLEPARGEDLGDAGGGARFLEGELGMRVQLAPQRDELGTDGLDVRGERGHSGILSLESESPMSRFIRPIVLGAAVVLAAFGYVHLAENKGYALKKGSVAPTFRLPALAGGEVDLASLRGRPVLLNFWATWCPPCVSEMPSLERLYRTLGKEGLAVVTVSVDEDDETLRRFVEEHHLTLPILPDPRARIAAS